MRLATFAVLLVTFAGYTPAAVAFPGRVTKVTKEVKISRPNSGSHAAQPNESIADGSEIQTGAGSQIELRFENGSLVRLAENTRCRLVEGARKFDLEQGAMLVRAPKQTGQIVVATGSSASSLAGTTSILERYPKAYIKLIALDGTARMFMPGVIGESVLVNAGQLLMFHTAPEPKSLPNPVDVDLKRLVATSLLLKGFAPLESENSIASEMKKQKRQKSDGALAETNLVIFGRGTLVSLVPPEAGAAKPSPTPTPSPRR